MERSWGRWETMNKRVNVCKCVRNRNRSKNNKKRRKKRTRPEVKSHNTFCLQTILEAEGRGGGKPDE